MIMKNLLRTFATILCAVFATATMVGCSDDNDDTPDSNPIRASTNNLRFSGSGSITTESDGWTLSEVGLYIKYTDSNIGDTIVYSPELKAKKAFNYTADWLKISYNKQTITLSADIYYYSDDYERHAIITLTKGDEVVIINVFNDPEEEWPEPVPLSRETIAFGADGGEEIVTVDDQTWVSQFLFEGKYVPDSYFSEGSKTFQWVTVEKMSADTWKINAAPNDETTDRHCTILFQRFDAYATLDITQSGK
jgi:hypothetical protein